MAVGSRSRNFVASRRRVADDGEDDDNDMASADMDSQSELSALNGANNDLELAPKPLAPSHAPTEGVADSANTASLTNGKKSDTEVYGHSRSTTFAPSVEPEPGMNGLEIPPGNHDEDIIEFDDADLEEYVPEIREQKASEYASTSTPTPASPQQTKRPPPSRSFKSGHHPQGSIGGSTTRQPQPMNNQKPRWSHDLHNSIQERTQNLKPASIPAASAASKASSMSTTVVMGLVTMRVMLPKMKEPIVYEKMPLKHHVRMPDLRPPLRRDKPVRIAIEDNPPRYIFPSVDRSFIFIPRAQRPNQQSRGYKNRGYLSQLSSRRGSVYGGSNQGASGAVSRRSSMARDGFISPAESVVSRAPYGAPTGPAARPVVRLPASHRPESHAPMQGANGVPVISSSLMPYPLPSRPALRENRDASVPMYQPKPQKTVSLDSLETSRVDRLQQPMQQEQQPFHHQMPALATGHETVQTTAETAILPEQAVNAQPFQPGQPMFYQPSYPIPAPYYYLPPGPDSQGLTYPSMAQYSMYPPPEAYLMPMGPGGPHATLYNQSGDLNYPQESNGMMFYYNAGPTVAGDQAAEGTQNGPYGYGGSDGGMKAEGPDFYYQPHTTMYYPTQ